jgi:hypothetical protein
MSTSSMAHSSSSTRTAVRTHVPVGGLACLMLEHRGSHQSRSGCARLARWHANRLGEAGVRLYAAGEAAGPAFSEPEASGDVGHRG